MAPGRLYKSDYRTFEAYCRERWGWSKAYVNRNIAAASVAGILAPIGAKPTSEAVARELAPLADQPAAVAEVWERVTEAHGERPTAKQVRETVRRIVPRELTHAEVVQQEVQTGIVRLRDWRTRPEPLAW